MLQSIFQLTAEVSFLSINNVMHVSQCSGCASEVKNYFGGRCDVRRRGPAAGQSVILSGAGALHCSLAGWLASWPSLPSLGRRPNGFVGLSLNDGTIIFPVV